MLKKIFIRWFSRIFAWFFVHGMLVVAVFGQTSVQVNSLRCPGTGTTAIILPVGSAGSISGMPIITFACLQLPVGWSIDTTTSPPTLRAPASIGVQPHSEVPSGSINGTNGNFNLSAPPASGYPLMLYRNGLLLSACSTTTACNGDYQISGAAILFLSATQTASGVSAIPQSGDLLQAINWH